MPIPRLLLAAALLPLLAGCTSPSPIGDSEASHAGVVCPPGTFVSSFTAGGAPSCTPAPSPAAGFSCPPREAVVGFTAAGVPTCANVSVSSAPSGPAPIPDDARKTLALTSNGAFANGVKEYVVASASGFATRTSR